MSFFSKFRHAFGFDDDTIFEIDGNDTGATDEHDATHEPEHVHSGRQSEDASMDDVREAIFTRVLDVFNGALPDFLARSVDPDAQRRLLYESLDQGLKDYLARIGADADSRCEARWSAEQASLRGEMEELKRKAEHVEHERAELRERQLSADRQKRALSDRLKDLENQVGRLEAEREQFDLENKSLMNKLKVVAVQHPDAVDGVDVPAGPSQEDFDKLSAENERMREALAQAADRQGIADEMVADLRRRLKVAQNEVEDLQAITEQVEKVQKAIEERDGMLGRQRENIARLRGQIDTLTASSAGAEQRFMAREQELLERIAALEIQLKEAAGAPAVVPEVKKNRRKRAVERPVEDSAPKITDDDLIDVEADFAGQDWFGAPAPEELAAQSSDAVADDFGYHAPEPKPRPYDDGMQMSLFD